MKYIITIITILSFHTGFTQNFWDKWTSYRIDDIYTRQDLPQGALGMDGRSIDYIYLPTELKAGTYEVTMVDANGDLYQVKGSNIYITVVGYLGYTGYSGKEGALVVNNYGTGSFYKRP